MATWTLTATPIIPQISAELVATAPILSMTINADIHAEAIPIGGEYYEGAYDFEPKFEAQQAETANKMMRDNVRIQPIEVTRVSNPQGGKTVYIGGIF